jgi:hypothetical protein
MLKESTYYARIARTSSIVILSAGTNLACAQCDYMEIIEKFAPKIILHKNDIHRPMDVETFIANSKLYDDNENIILSSVTLDDLTNPLYNQSNYSLGNYDFQGSYYGPANVVSDRTGDPLDLNNEVTSKCYAKVIEHDGYVDIVYGFFYQWNGFQIFRASILDLFSTVTRNFEWRDFARHEGDWEHVTVRLSPDLETVIGVFGAAHGDSKFYSIESGDIHFEGTHPRMFAALNSHATYPTEGVRSNVDITTVPVFSILWLKDADVTGNVDVNTYETDPVFDSIVWNTWNNVLWVDNPVDSIDAHKWLNFTGDFGVKMPESQIESTPSLPANAESDLYVSATVGAFVGLLDDYIHKSGPSSPLQQTNWWNIEEAPLGNHVLIEQTQECGTGELVFDDSPELYDTTKLNEIYIEFGSRIDQVRFLIDNTNYLTHGSGGGSSNSLTLAVGEKVTQIEMTTANFSGSLRIFWIKFTTNLGATLEGGFNTGTYVNINVPADKVVVGMYGNASSGINNLGFLMIDEVPIEPCTDITNLAQKVMAETEYSLYPNPAQKSLEIRNEQNISFKQLRIYEASGTLIDTQDFLPTTVYALDVSELKVGSYYLAIVGDDVVEHAKFIKN